MRKKISLITMGLLLILLIVMTTVACDKNGAPEQPYGKGLDVSFLEGFTIDLSGITALAIEKRATTQPATSSNVVYADEISEKNKLVGETEDKSVVEVTLRNKMGETFLQDELQAEFNKLWVSGNFVYFELRPIDYLESLEEISGHQVYPYYKAEDLTEDGTPKEGARREWTEILIREDIAEEDLEEFEKSSMPHPITASFVYSIESDKIYDLSETGYMVMGKDVVNIGGTISRTHINEDGEFETTALLNAYHEARAEDLRVDKYGNLFGKSVAEFIDEESRVFMERESHSTVWYVLNDEGQAVQISDEGEVKWIDENGLRDLEPTDNMDAEWTPWTPSWRFFGVENGVPNIYNRLATDPTHIALMDGPIRINKDIAVGTVRFVSSGDYKIDDEFIFLPNPNFEISPYILVWFDATEIKEIKEIYTEDGAYWDFSGYHIICEDMDATYPNYDWDIYYEDYFTVVGQNGETKYEPYWDEDEQTVKIRVLEETIAPPKEVKKFQPIGG